MKIYLLIPFLFAMSGCSYFSVNATNCDNLMMNEPNMNNIPQECRDYKEEDAEKSTYPDGHTPIEVNKEFQLGK